MRESKYKPILQALTAPSEGYYIYELTDQHGVVFYVGKGSGNRVLLHELEAQSGCACQKCERIRAVWRASGEVGKRIVHATASENEAYRLERELIAKHGPERLANVLRGRGVARARKPPVNPGHSVRITNLTEEERALLWLLTPAEKTAALLAAARVKAVRISTIDSQIDAGKGESGTAAEGDTAS